MKNHSQLADLLLKPEKIFEMRVGRKPGNPRGIETPLGHTYSMVLEAFAQERIDATPKPGEFLRFIDERQERFNRGTTFETPTYYPSITRPLMEYMLQKGLSGRRACDVMEEVLGSRFLYPNPY